MRKRKNHQKLILKIVLGITAVAVVLAGVLVATAIISTEENMKTAKDEKETIHISSNDDFATWLAGRFGKSDEENVEEVNDLGYQDKINPKFTYIGDTNPRIVCVGDSLTATTGEKYSYPDQLRELSQATVVNLGRDSDMTKTMARRVGSIPVYVEAVTIPAKPAKVTVRLVDENGKEVNLLPRPKEGEEPIESLYVGINPCKIADVKGNLKLEEDGTITFERSKEGEEVNVLKGTTLTTAGELARKDGDVLILFAGANDELTLENFDEITGYMQGIIDSWKDSNAPATSPDENPGADARKFIVIGTTYSRADTDMDEIAQKMEEKWGDHFLDIRKYLIENGLNDAEIPGTPTAQDQEDIENGLIPSSLRTNYVHGNEYYYKILAEQVYRKMMYLGYLPLPAEYAATKPSERVVFWGDSLTQGTKGDGSTFPATVRSLAAKDGKYIDIRNYGVYNEMSGTIAARAGAVDLKLSSSVTIPADSSPVKVKFSPDLDLLVNGGDRTGAARVYDGDNSVNPCILGGVEGRISCDEETNALTFTRLTPGEETTVESGSVLETWASRDTSSDDILVLWNGNNDLTTEHGKSVDTVIKNTNKIIEKTGTDRYVVLNIAKIDKIPTEKKVNERLAEEYGEHLLDIRSYLLDPNGGLKDAGITPTEEDLKDIEEGRVPSSLRQDIDCHFTPDGYRVVGQQVYKKLCELGYL